MEGMTELVFVYYCILAYYQGDWTAFVHPFKALNEMAPYAKSFSIVEGILSHLTRAHLEALLQSGKCESFVRFYDSLFNTPEC